MKKNRHLIFGFTMVEIMVSTVILSLALTAAISGWLYVFRGEKMNSVQNELDMDVRKAMERIRADLRLSSIDKMYYYPAGPGPYTAISMPLARDDNGDGLLELDSGGKIIWDKTVIYHVWAGTPNQLRKTTFDPRNTNRTPAEMQAQIDSVVTVGNGTAAYDSSTATTMPVFQNLFNWDIYGKGAQYDAYRPMLNRDSDVVFGSALLTPGSHSVTFRVVGKNAASTGYKIGVDSVVMSPCGIPREAEAQTVSANVGATAVGEYMGGSWDGCYQMSFPATATGQYFTMTMENDRWEETNFRGDGSICDDTRVDFEETYSPKTFVVRCIPPTTNWYASTQTLDTTPDDTVGDELRGAAVRVLLRGANMLEGNGIKNSGLFHCLWLRSSSAKDLHVKGAYIAECASDSNYSPNAKSTGMQLFYGGAGDFTIPNGASSPYLTLGAGSTLYIEREKSYVVSFLVASNADTFGSLRWFQNPVNPSNPTPPGCYMIPGSANPDLTATRAMDWSSNTNVVIDPFLYGVEHVHCLAASNGTWTSQIVDTHLTAPTYTTLTWNDVKPSGTTLKMKLRTGNLEDMSDATAWSNLTAMTAGGAINPASKRFVQVQTEMWSDSTFYYVPSLKDFTVKWDGLARVVDIGGTISQSASNGVFEILLDGSNIIKRGVTIDLTIFQWVRGFSPGPVGSNILTSTVSAEVEPRNTGK
jgi:type II secretory pathway pseudopilin PulG